MSSRKCCVMAVFAILVAPRALAQTLPSGAYQRFDASQASTIIATGGVVSAWNDVSGNGRHATADSARANPVNYPAIVNFPSTPPTPGVEFGSSGVSRMIVLSNADARALLDFSGTGSATGGFSCGIVWMLSSPGLPTWNDQFGCTSVVTAGLGIRSNAPGNNSLQAYAKVTLAHTGLPVVAGAPVVQVVNYDAASGLFGHYDSLNDLLTTTTVAAGDFTAANPLWLGNMQNAGRYLAGEVAEVVIYNKALTPAEMENVQNYLIGRWVNGTIPLFGPEVEVKDGVTDIANGGGPVDFGLALPGTAPLSKTFTVSNTGTAELTASNLAVPSGYSITEPLSASIAVGASDTFTVQLPTTAEGTFSGDISFNNNDSDENPFHFSVTGRVASVSRAKDWNLFE